MAENQIKQMSSRHEQILNYILLNPTKTYGEVAGHFGVTPAWLSVIIHSDAFQRRLSERQDEIFDAGVLQPISDKLSAAADLTIDKYLEKVPTFTADQLISSTDKLLGKLGFGSKTSVQPGGTIINGNVYQQVNNGHVPKEVIAEARNKIGNSSNQMGKAYKCAALLYQTTYERLETEGC